MTARGRWRHHAVVEIRTRPKGNMRRGWRAVWAAAKRHRRMTELALRMRKPPPKRMPVAVTLTRHSAGTLDDDNLRDALKAVRDGVADYLGRDDADPSVVWLYQQAKAPRGTYRVEIEIVETAAPICPTCGQEVRS